MNFVILDFFFLLNSLSSCVGVVRALVFMKCAGVVRVIIACVNVSVIFFLCALVIFFWRVPGVHRTFY